MPDDHPTDSGSDQSLGARGRLAIVTARLKVHVDRRAFGFVRLQLAEHRHLGMGAAKEFVMRLCQYLFALDGHRTHQRIGAGIADPLGRLVQRKLHEKFIGARVQALILD